VLGSLVLGARVVGAAAHTEPVWVASATLAAGTVLTSGDLELRDVRLESLGDRYLRAADVPDPSGRVLVRDVVSGELVARAALAPGPSDGSSDGSTEGAGDPVVDRRQVTVAVDPAHAPPDLDRGALVDVYVTPGAEHATTAQPERVLAGALVAGVERDVARLGSTGDGMAVVLAVSADDVPRVVAALHRGPVDLVGRPVP
jgi:hypothetical protein